MFVTLGEFGAPAAGPGVVAWDYYCTSLIDYMQPPPLPGSPIEHEYVYYVELEEPWLEKEGQIYWLTVTAVYPITNPTGGPWFQWGWKTTHPDENWNDDAVIWDGGRGWEELRYPPYVWPWAGVTNHIYEGESVNMAFELFTDVCPRRARKWAQPPDMWRGMNADTYAPSGQVWTAEWPLRADDFVSDGRIISDLHWWGSYLLWGDNTNGVVPPPSGAEGLIGFEIGWHQDVPTNAVRSFSMPSNPPMKQLFVPIEYCHEMYYGVVSQEWVSPFPYEHEYQYYVDLLDPLLPGGGGWKETNGVIYWLSIQGVFDAGWPANVQEPRHFGWGWKTTDPSNHWNDVSVVATNFPQPWDPEWTPGEFRPATHPWAREGKPMDLAFELTTHEVGSNRWYQPIWIRSIRAWASLPNRVISVGDWGSGTQYLQVNTNLMLTNDWVDVATNPLPWPFPYSNTWLRVNGNPTQEHYRIEQR